MWDCKTRGHKLRENPFGVTWCMSCGGLSTKPSKKKLDEDTRKRWNLFGRK
jgi:hypothetical protein